MRNAIFGGIILAMIQLVEVGMVKWQMKGEMQMMQKMQAEQFEMMKAQMGKYIILYTIFLSIL